MSCSPRHGHEEADSTSLTATLNYVGGGMRAWREQTKAGEAKAGAESQTQAQRLFSFRHVGQATCIDTSHPPDPLLELLDRVSAPLLLRRQERHAAQPCTCCRLATALSCVFVEQFV